MSTTLCRYVLIVALLLVQLTLLGFFVKSLGFIMETRTMFVVTQEKDNSAQAVQEEESSSSSLLMAKTALIHPKPTNYDPPKLVWLLSFPNR
jgi:hypothetical protein